MQIGEQSYLRILKQYRGVNLIAEMPELILDDWHHSYMQTYPKSDLVLVHLDAKGSSFTYLFDVPRQRVVGSVGLPTFVKNKRDQSRMRGFPLADSEHYDRGHLLAHSLGGDADINLIPQLSKVNRGGFRRIELEAMKLASQNVACVYFVRPLYPLEAAPAKEATWLPDEIEQGLISSTGNLVYDKFPNTI